MGNPLTDGFSGSIPQTDADIETALTTGLLSLDANVLLNFYRYSPNARDALVSVLRAAGDRVWVSHQAAREFWRNRVSAIDGRSNARQAFEEALDKSEATLRGALDAWAKQTAVPEGTKKEVVDALSGGFDRARELISAEAHGAGEIAYDGSNDVVLDVLRDLLSSNVGAALTSSEHEEALSEAKRRIQDQVPPGFKDANKDQNSGPDGANGDYLVWIQSIKEALSRDVPLVIVTGDEKEDWWWRHRTSFFGPRRELVEEFSAHSARGLYMLRPVQLIDHAGALNVAVSEDAAADVARASSREAEALWTRTAVLELLRRLDWEGREQADIIRAAALGEGFIHRDEIYTIAGYEEDRMLRGFTRPTARITRDLQEEGLLPEGVEPALTPHYEGGVTAQWFEVPSEFIDILSDESSSSSAASSKMD